MLNLGPNAPHVLVVSLALALLFTGCCSTGTPPQEKPEHESNMDSAPSSAIEEKASEKPATITWYDGNEERTRDLTRLEIDAFQSMTYAPDVEVTLNRRRYPAWIDYRAYVRLKGWEYEVYYLGVRHKSVGGSDILFGDGKEMLSMAGTERGEASLQPIIDRYGWKVCLYTKGDIESAPDDWSLAMAAFKQMAQLGEKWVDLLESNSERGFDISSQFGRALRGDVKRIYLQLAQTPKGAQGRTRYGTSFGSLDLATIDWLPPSIELHPETYYARGPEPRRVGEEDHWAIVLHPGQIGIQRFSTSGDGNGTQYNRPRCEWFECIRDKEGQIGLRYVGRGY